MNYNVLLNMATELGYQLAMCGAETYRVEESITRILSAYDIQAEVFSIPNYLIVSINTTEDAPVTKMRRIGHHGNNMEGVERLSNLSRKICSETPPPEVALEWVKDEVISRKNYKLPILCLGGFLGGAGYAVFFGGSLADSLCSGICGILIALIEYWLGKVKVNRFFVTIAAAFVMALTAYTFGLIGVADNTGPVIIGALMSLVPGWLFTNALRDIIFGDTNSGINRIVQVLLVAAAIALGTGAAWNFLGLFWELPIMPEAVSHADWINCLAAFVGCIGFILLFNIHGKGSILCALGGMLTWATWSIAKYLSGDEFTAFFFAVIFADFYSEIMARLRKYPAFSYQVISMFPLIPGAGIYYATNYLVLGDVSGFMAKSSQTISIAGILAVGILIVSTTVRFMTTIKHQKK